MSASGAHRLDPLLAPRSIALVGASIRPETPGNDMVRMARCAGFAGRLYPINRKYSEVEGLRCYPSLAALPETVDHVVLGVANRNLEAALDDAIGHGARAATIFASGVLEGDRDPPLAVRLAASARNAGISVCGGNAMGFYNMAERLRVVGFPSPLDMEPGSISFIAQSGSVFGALAHNDRRLKFNLAVSSGGEWVTTAADYLDWALHQAGTRAIGLFLEAVRNPEAFRAALDQSLARDIPVIVLKVGRTPESAAMALSHTGALAGNDAAYEALFDRYGVVRVETLDELAASLLLLSHPKRPARGRLAAMHDSGGEREMVADLAVRHGVRYAAIGPETRQRIEAHLDPGLDAQNPLDAWGSGEDVENRFAACMSALLDDPATAIGVLFADIRDGYFLHTRFADAMLKAARATPKPVAIASNYALVRHEAIAKRLTEAGVPVLDGTEEALRAIRHTLAYRDFRLDRGNDPPPGIDDTLHARWAARLAGTPEAGTALALLADAGIATPAWRIATSLAGARRAAQAVGYPVALKTAQDIAHKTEACGVRLGLGGTKALDAAYRELAQRLGPRVLVQAMVGQGVEIGLGAVNDPMFGPIVMVAAGGVLIELLDDRAVALAPFGQAKARALIGRLRIAKLLAGVRGAPPADLGALTSTIARFSTLAYALRDAYAEIDLNPVIATETGAYAVDALIVPRQDAG